MVLEEVQYVSNESGRATAVLVPIELLSNSGRPSRDRHGWLTVLSRARAARPLWREIESERETAYLLKSPTMARRLLEARGRTEGIVFDAAIEKLGL